MRRRVIRDIGTIAGVVVILAAIILVNDLFSRSNIAEQMITVRQNVEKGLVNKGNEILPWDLLRKTKGTRKSGPTFAEELLEQKDKQVNLVGFMTPLYDFRDVKEFLFLPMPIQCYFCESPPMRDVVLVQLAEGTKMDIVEEPIVVDGTLTLNEGPGTKFFYVLKDAESNKNLNGKMTKKKFSDAHIQESQAAEQAEKAAAEPLLDPNEPPTASSANADE